MSENTAVQTGTEQSAQAGSHQSWARPFFTIWIGQALSLVGSQAGGFALVWWLTQESGGSATILALMTFIAMLPNVILGPFVGALVDRWDRRRVMIVADSAIALFSAGLAVLLWLNALQIWHVYVIMFVRALGGTFHFSAMQASTSLMVPKSQLSRIGGMNQTLRGALDIITPPLGALLMELIPLYAIMGIDVITAAFAVAPLFFIAIPQPPRRAVAEHPTLAGRRSPVVVLLRDVWEGFGYIWHWTGLFIILLMATVLNMLANQAAVAISNASLHQLVSKKAYTDTITGLANRRALDERLDDEIINARRTNSPFAIVMMDLDGFKSVNDTHGHEVGDLVLRAVFNVISVGIRSSDFIARYGGDELTLILTRSNLQAATLVTDKIQETLAKFSYKAPDGSAIKLGISGGIAVFPEHGRSGPELLRAADAALYYAKKHHRGTFQRAKVVTGPLDPIALNRTKKGG